MSRIHISGECNAQQKDLLNATFNLLCMKTNAQLVQRAPDGTPEHPRVSALFDVPDNNRDAFVEGIKAMGLEIASESAPAAVAA